MAIREGGVSAVSVGELLKQNLRIPPYQRPYSWRPETALQLVEDINEAWRDSERRNVPYVLGAVILHAKKNDQLDLVDGQQRLLTLRMILAILDSKDEVSLPTSGNTPVSLVWRALRERLATVLDEEKGSFLKFVHDKCQLVRIVTDDVDEAFRVFDSQNYRGKPLAPHDLLKAHHLREMRNESAAMKAAVVETWESVKDDDLSRLFSIYLYRIARWSRGKSAPGFTIHDIGMFKGISPKGAKSPSARYHLAAQTALPMFGALGDIPDGNARDFGRSRFQIDAPLLAGQPFFEMVTFMLQELKHLVREAFENDTSDFGVYDLDALSSDDILEERPSKIRYRYVSELYLAALLYYTNKFGGERVGEIRKKLFTWAYALRVKRLRVQFLSVDNRAQGEEDGVASAFTLLRSADTGQIIHQLSEEIDPYEEGHEGPLAALLNEYGGVQ